MKQVFSKGGTIVTEEIPPPSCPEGHILIKNAYSLISPGTERMSFDNSSGGLISKVLKQPGLIKKVISKAVSEGVAQTADKVREKMTDMAPLGYSSAGTVIEVGKGVSGFSVGDKVACAGAGYACHAEVVTVPKNLVSKIPSGVDLREATFVTLGAIAMQGVRRAQVQVGDRVAVIGLGLIGQLTVQILQAAGCHVIGIDIDKKRTELARGLGLKNVLLADSEGEYVAKVLGQTQNVGADVVLIAAATGSSEPVNNAFRIARRKGRVVVIGAVGMDLKREDFYRKELDFLISTSYGPGRYDEEYEEKGIDYPIGYVRWTENRNMEEFLQMLAEQKLNLEPLIDYEFSIEEADKAYNTLLEKSTLGILFRYPEEVRAERKLVVDARPITKDVLNVAVIGAGAFAKTTHLPNLKRIKGYDIRAIVTGKGMNAKHLAEQYHAAYASSDYREIMADDEIDLVLIATRHNLHAKIAIEAAKAGKNIFLEKPMALDQTELDLLVEAITQNKINFMLGFNRRFSPLSTKACELLQSRRYPIAMVYRVNAGSVSPDHWVNDPEAGGGRIIGECCHFLDLMSWFARSPIKSFGVKGLSGEHPEMESENNISVSLEFENGSIGTLLYTTLGASSFPKERLEIYSDGSVLVIEDFKQLEIYGQEVQTIKLKRQDKGHYQELVEFLKVIKGESSKGVTLDEAIAITKWTLRIKEALRR